MRAPAKDGPVGNDEMALLAAVVAAPADDLPRLVYADWLDDHGCHSRAELIRLQCFLAASTPGPPAVHRAANRVRQLLLRHSVDWSQRLVRAGASEVVFERGFPSSFRMTAARFLRAAPHLSSSTPVSCLRLDASRGRLAQLAACPALQTVERLDLSSNRLGDDEVGELSAHCLPRLTRLSVDANRLTAKGVSRLLGSALPRLEQLTARANSLEDRGIDGLADAEGVRLQVLDLSDNWIGDYGAITLATGRLLGTLSYLSLTGNRIGESGLAALQAAAGECTIIFSRARSWELEINRKVHSTDSPGR